MMDGVMNGGDLHRINCKWNMEGINDGWGWGWYVSDVREIRVCNMYSEKELIKQHISNKHHVKIKLTDIIYVGCRILRNENTDSTAHT